jgi:hypothetical protein
MGDLIRLRPWEPFRYGNCLNCVYIDKIIGCFGHRGEWYCKIKEKKMNPKSLWQGCKNYKKNI